MKLGRFVKITFLGDTADVDAKGQRIQRQAGELEAEMDKTRTKLAAMWSYGNQIANMVLAQLSKAAEGGKYETAMQSVVAGLQYTQTQVAIAQTVLQASAAAAAGHGFQAASLYSIAGFMQANLIQQIRLRQEAKRAEQLASRIARHIATYRSG